MEKQRCEIFTLNVCDNDEYDKHKLRTANKHRSLYIYLFIYLFVYFIFLTTYITVNMYTKSLHFIDAVNCYKQK